VTVVVRFKEYEDWLVESSHKLHGKGKNEALKEEKLAQVSHLPHCVVVVRWLRSSDTVTDHAASQNWSVCNLLWFLLRYLFNTVRYGRYKSWAGKVTFSSSSCIAIRIRIILRSWLPDPHHRMMQF
jgi:hypothetical protein